jgi:phage terminase small subunit
MTGPLRNVRWERFVQALFEGQNATEAYATAGFVKDDGNATRLRANPKVQERLAELQAAVAAKTQVTVESICKELDEANAVAKERGQASAMVSASALRAKLAGLMVDKVEVGPAGSFDKCESVEEVVADLLRYESPHVPVHEQDRRALIKMYQSHFAEVEEFLAALRAKPIPPEIAYKARRIELQRSGNGKARP